MIDRCRDLDVKLYNRKLMTQNFSVMQFSTLVFEILYLKCELFFPSSIFKIKKPETR